jgi:hypothetical protein
VLLDLNPTPKREGSELDAVLAMSGGPNGPRR